MTVSKDNIRDQIIEGLKDPDTVRQLLKEQNLTLPATITTCRGLEAADKEVNNITGASVKRISNHRKTKNKDETRQNYRQPPVHRPT